MTVAETFARWALALHPDDIERDTRRAVTLHLLDGVGCALAAARTDAAVAPVEVARSLGGAPEATIIGTDERVAAPAAALANGALVHALDFDDTHTGALVHATSAVLPAAFAAAEATKASGAETLAACATGYEMVIRLGAAVRHGFHARGFHATSVCGVFAGALAAARLYGLTAEQTVSALGIAGSLASGSLEFLETGSSTKQIHPGLAGMNALIAVRLAAAGADGPASIIEGEHGLFRAFAGTAIDGDALTDGLGVTWETRLTSIKPYPCCQLSVASLDAARLALRAVDLADVERITFEVPEGVASIVCEPESAKRAPRTPYEAKFSLPYCVAALAIDGRLDIDSFAPEAIARPDVLALAARVEHRVVEVPVAPADAPGVVTVQLRDGSETTTRTGRATGDADAPMSDDDILAKFHANAGGRTERTERLADDLLRLRDLATLEPVLQGARR